MTHAASGQETVLLGAMEKIAVKASGGLTSFTAEAKHEFLKDIGKLCVELGFDVPALGARPDSTKEGPKYPQVEVQLTDGNAFAILRCIQKAMHAAGIPNEEYRAFEKEATQVDYDHLLRTAMKWVTVK
jgi:hypothetical protein